MSKLFFAIEGGILWAREKILRVRSRPFRERRVLFYISLVTVMVVVSIFWLRHMNRTFGIAFIGGSFHQTVVSGPDSFFQRESLLTASASDQAIKTPFGVLGENIAVLRGEVRVLFSAIRSSLDTGQEEAAPSSSLKDAPALIVLQDDERDQENQDVEAEEPGSNSEEPDISLSQKTSATEVKHNVLSEEAVGWREFSIGGENEGQEVPMPQLFMPDRAANVDSEQKGWARIASIFATNFLALRQGMVDFYGYLVR